MSSHVINVILFSLCTIAFIIGSPGLAIYPVLAGLFWNLIMGQIS